MYMKRLLAILIMFWSLLGIVYGQNEFEKTYMCPLQVIR